MKGEIEFPVTWNYKIIVTSPDVKSDIDNVMKEHGFADVQVTEGNVSKKGNFVSLRASVPFDSLEQMQKLSNDLESISEVKFIL
jgi:putative lipoic acid-binding regulatory protein